MAIRDKQDGITRGDTADAAAYSSGTKQGQKRLRLVAWNCSQGLRRKADRLLELNPDVAVVAECRNEPVLGDGLLRSIGWIGRNPHKGLGVYARPPLVADVSPAWDPSREWFLPVHLEGMNVDVIGVWAMNHRGGEEGPKRGRTRRALEHYGDVLALGRSIVIGDFNDNVRWDTARHPEFRTLLAWLRELGYVSCYHALINDAYGHEEGASLYWQHRTDQPYLVDYAFLPVAWLPAVSQFSLGDRSWLQWSDHVPICLELDLVKVGLEAGTPGPGAARPTRIRTSGLTPRLSSQAARRRMCSARELICPST